MAPKKSPTVASRSPTLRPPLRVAPGRAPCGRSSIRCSGVLFTLVGIELLLGATLLAGIEFIFLVEDIVVAEDALVICSHGLIERRDRDAFVFALLGADPG